MRGKQPGTRDRYVIRMRDGTLVEVTRKVYLEWYQSERRERYQKERDRKNGVCSLEVLNSAISEENDPEELVLRKLCCEKVREAVKELTSEEINILYLLFYRELSVKETAQLCECSRTAIYLRRKRIFDKLRGKIQDLQ